MEQVEWLVQTIRQGIRGEAGPPQASDIAYTTDFSGLARSVPGIVVKATCEQDIAHCLRVAQAAGIPVTLRGAGHSCNGQALIQGGILIVNLTDAAQFRMVDAELVEVSGRTTWMHLERVLNRLGRSIPVLPNYLDLSVGGTLAVGGYGERSVRYGAQFDQVERLRLIKPDGSALWCSPCEETELFRYSLAGLGQLGVIEGVVMRTIPYQKITKLLLYTGRSLDQLLASLSWLAERQDDRPDHFHAYFDDAAFTVAYGLEYPSVDKSVFGKLSPALRVTEPNQVQLIPNYAFALHRMTQKALTRLSDQWRPAVDYCLDFDGLAAFLPFLLSRLRNEHVAPYLPSPLLYILAVKQSGEVAPFAASAAAGPAKASGLVYSVGLRPIIPQSDSRGLETVHSLFRSLLEKCVEFGGRPYLYGSHVLDKPMKQKLYGRAYERLTELRGLLDPHGLFNADAL